MSTDFGALGYRIYSHLADAEKILRGELPLPKTAVLHPTYICNHNCPGCDFREQNRGDDKKEKRIWTMDDGEYVQRQLKEIEVRGVEFSGGGEPLLFSGVKDMIRYFSDNGISTGILTNGTYLEGKVRDAIVNSSSYIRASLESGSPEVFGIAKGIKRAEEEFEFARVVENLRETINLRNRKGSKLNIGIKFTVGRHNYTDMENAILLGIDLGVDSIQFRLYENVDGVDFREESEDREIERTEGLTQKLEQLRLNYGNQINILGNLRKTQLEGKCWLSPLITVIDAVGDVYICSYYRHRQESHKIGNIFKDSSFRNLWFSERHIKAIQNVNPDECNKYDCRFHRYNKTMGEAIENRFFDFL